MQPNKQLLKRESLTLTMVETGDNANDIVAKVFKQIHSQLYQQVGKPIIQVETDAVYFDEVSEIPPRKGVLNKGKKQLEIKVRVVLLVRYLEIE